MTDDAIARLDSAQMSWTAALEAHWSAPPAPGYDERLLQLANAAEEQASAFRFADREGLAWRPLPNAAASLQPPPELRPDFNRTGPPELWGRFDESVRELGLALEGVSSGESRRCSTSCPSLCASSPTPTGPRSRCVSGAPASRGGRRGLPAIAGWPLVGMLAVPSVVERRLPGVRTVHAADGRPWPQPATGFRQRCHQRPADPVQISSARARAGVADQVRIWLVGLDQPDPPRAEDAKHLRPERRMAEARTPAESAPARSRVPEGAGPVPWQRARARAARHASSSRSSA